MIVRWAIWRARHIAKVLSRHSTFGVEVSALVDGVTVGKFQRGKRIR